MCYPYRYLPTLTQDLFTTGHVPARLSIGVMLFMACLITYMLRVNMSVNILAMVTNGTVQPDVRNMS